MRYIVAVAVLVLVLVALALALPGSGEHDDEARTLTPAIAARDSSTGAGVASL